MEVQTESTKPPPPLTAEPQSAGKINKAAFKLFGKRRTGGGMAGIFSMRNKGGEGGGGGGGGSSGGGGGGGIKGMVRSKTHDGITTGDGNNASTSPLSDTSEGSTLGNPSAGMSGTDSQDLNTSGRFFSSSGWFTASMPSAMPSSTRGSMGKSISFFSLLRRNSVRGGDGAGSSGAGGSSGCNFGRRSRGLRGLFSSWRWRRKPRARPQHRQQQQQQQQQEEEENEEFQMAREVKEGDILHSRSGSIDLLRNDATSAMTSHLQALAAQAVSQNSLTMAMDAMASMHSGNLEEEAQGTRGRESSRDLPTIPHTVFEERSPDVSPLRAPVGDGVRRGEADNKPCSPTRLVSDSPQDSSCMTPPLDRSLADPPSEPSVDRLCSMFNDVTSLKSFDSLTGCGDIIADVEDEPSNGNGNGTSSGTASSCTTSSNGTSISGRRGSPTKPALSSQVTSPISQSPMPQVSPFLPAHQRVLAASSISGAVSSSTCPPKKQPSPQPPAQGSGVVAYMGGGEEMASPEGVNDADMQGLWHMLPQKGEDSPDLRRSEHHGHHHGSIPSSRANKRTPPSVKALGLSKIPVSGGNGQSGKQQTPTRPSPPPVDKDLQEAPPSDEGYWDSPTPVAEDEDSSFLSREMRMPRESCSGDALYDLYDPDSPSALGSDEDDDASSQLSASTLSPRSPSQRSDARSSFRSLKGSTSLPRESKIPVSIRTVQPVPHSSSHAELSRSVSGSGSRPTTPISRPTTPVSSRPTTPRLSTRSPQLTAAPLVKSGIPQPTRTRIPISKVPMRRSGRKSGTTNTTGNSTRNRK